MKKVSFILVLAMLINLFTCIGPVMATEASTAPDSTLIYSSSFSDYTADGKPTGWIAPKYIVQNFNEVAPTGSNVTYVKESDYNNSIKISSAADTVKEVIPFNKMITSGKLHISFDGMRTATSNNGFTRIVLFNDYNPGEYLTMITGSSDYVKINDYSASDLSDFRGFAFGHHTTMLLQIPNGKNADNKEGSDRVSTTTKGGWGQCDVYSNKVAELNQWYHIDMVIDLDNKQYDAWMDGVKLNDTPGKWTSGLQQNVTGFKGLGILQRNDAKIDNISISRYVTGEKIQMMLDSGKTVVGPDSEDGKLLKVSFNDYLSSDLRDSDFKITDPDGGEVSGVSILSDTNTKYGCVLDFTNATNLKANTDYTITVNASSVNGTATNASVNGAAAVFRTAAEKIDTSASDYRYYYADEDFESFTAAEHLPLGFYRGNQLIKNKSNGSEQYSKYLSTGGNGTKQQAVVNGKDGGSALQLNNESPSLFYFLPRGVVTGDFTVEFDMKYKGGEWSFGLIPTRNWLNTDFQDTNGYLDNYREINALIGMSAISEAAAELKAPNLAVVDTDTLDPNNKILSTAKDTGLDITAEEWTHIKLDFDMADGKFDITLTNGENTVSKQDVSYGDWNKFGNGVEGLLFRKNKSANGGYLDIDNLSVYSNSGRLLDQDFNGYVSQSAKRFPYFWISDNRLNSTIKTNRRHTTVNPNATSGDAYTTTGKTGETGDNAVKLTTQGKKSVYWYSTQFANRVPAGQSYAVEFDLKTEGDSTAWNIGPIDATRTTNLIGYNTGEGDFAAKLPDQYLINTYLLAYYNGNFYKYAKSTQASVGLASAHLTGNNYFSSIGSLDSSKVGQWNHYKLIAKPKATGVGTDYTLIVNSDTNNKIDFSDSLKNNQKDICGIAFTTRNQNGESSEQDWGVLVDNIAAYLCDANGTEITTARQNSITDITAEKADGSSVSVKDSTTIPYSTKKITITFSEDLKEVKKADLTPVTIDNHKYQTSDGVTTTIPATDSRQTKAIYDCIEDVIQLREDYKDYPMSYTSEISGNKYIITLDNMIQENKKYSLHVAKNVNFVSSPFSALDKSYSMTFTGANEEDGYIMSECQLVKTGTTTESITNISDIQGSESSLAVKLSGINTTGATKKMRAIVAFYNEAGTTELVNVALTDFEFAAVSTKESVVQNLDVSALADGKTYNKVKLFVWDADTLMPMMDKPIVY